MTAYLTRRLVASAIVLLIVSVITYLLIHLQSGDVLAATLRQRIPAAQVEALRAEIGLDRPFAEQYLDWLGGAIRGDLGNSLYRRQDTVWGRIQDALPVTLELIVIAMVSGTLVGLPLGVLSAVRRNSFIDHLVRVFAITGLAFPVFWVSTVVLVYGAIWFGYAPPSVYVNVWEDPAENLRSVLVPGLVLGYNLSSYLMRITRSAVLEVLEQDYVRTAWSKGLRERTVVFRHVLRNALIPVATIVGNLLVFTLGGTIIVETPFHLPGLGSLTFDAIRTRDYTLMQGCVVIVAAMAIAVNLVVDMSYAWLDPRVRMGAKEDA
jgi:peptide/nickel transport system permease protein